MDFNNEVSMKRILIILSILAMFMMGFATTAFAQPADSARMDTSGEHSMMIEGNINLSFPEGWGKAPDDKKGRASAVLEDPKTGNRIEVYHRKMVLETNSTLLFEQFKAHLEEADLVEEPSNDAGSRTITLADGTTRNGEYYVYRYNSSDITVSVNIFMFSVGLHAYIVVGYFIKAEQEPGLDAFEKMLNEMTVENDH